MNKFLTAAAVVASLGVALPAAAQSFGGRDHGGDRGIEFQIDRGVRNGSLTPVEARSLNRQLEAVRILERRYSRDGVSNREARELDRRYAELSAKLRAESRDHDNRGYGQGYGRGGFDGRR